MMLLLIPDMNKFLLKALHVSYRSGRVNKIWYHTNTHLKLAHKGPMRRACLSQENNLEKVETIPLSII